MNKQQWSKPVSPTEAARRAGGRRRYNAQRAKESWVRKWAAIQLWKQGRSSREIAAEVGVVVRTANRYTKGVRTLAAQRELSEWAAHFFGIVENGFQDR